MSLVRDAGVARLLPDVDAKIGDEELFSSIVRHMRDEPSFYATDRDALLMEYRALSNEIGGFLPQYFRRLPSLPCAIYPMDDDISQSASTAFYIVGSFESQAPSTAFVNLLDLSRHPSWYRRPVIYHESIPGHHLEQTMPLDNDGLIQLQKSLYLTAFSEGWATYAEVLAGEMGLYRSEWERLGALFSRMVRACRLVIDTGIHSRGWSIQDSEALLCNNVPFSESVIRTEVRRAIAWPGQGLSYLVGMQAILDARQRAQAALGKDFDIREFHDEILVDGPMPLPMLEEKINAWIEREKLD